MIDDEEYEHITHMDFSVDGSIIRCNTNLGALKFYKLNGGGEPFTDYKAI